MQDNAPGVMQSAWRDLLVVQRKNGVEELGGRAEGCATGNRYERIYSRMLDARGERVWDGF